MIRISTIIYGLLALILSLPLFGFFWNYLLVLPSSAKQITAEIAIFVGLLFVSKQKVKIPTYIYFLIIYIIYSSLVDYYNKEFVNRNILKLFQLKMSFIATLFVLVIIENFHTSEEFIKKCIQIIKIFIILSTIISVIQVFDSSFLRFNYDDDYFSQFTIYTVRRASLFGFEGSNSMVLTFIPLLALLIGYMIIKKDEKKVLLFLFLAGVIAFLSNSRTTMIGFVLVVLQYVMAKRIKTSFVFKYVIILFSLLVVLYYAIILIGYDLNAFYDQRIMTEDSIEQSARYVSYEVFLDIFGNNSLFGMGNQNSSLIMRALGKGSPNMHVGYLSHLLTYGIVGSFFLFGFWFLLFKRIFRSSVKTNFWGSFVGFLIFIVYNLFFTNFSIFFSGLIMCIVFIKHFEQNISLDKDADSLRLLPSNNFLKK